MQNVFKMIANEPVLEDDEFFRSKVVNHLEPFIGNSNVIVANSIAEEIRQTEDGVFVREFVLK